MNYEEAQAQAAMTLICQLTYAEYCRFCQEVKREPVSRQVFRRSKALYAKAKNG